MIGNPVRVPFTLPCVQELFLTNPYAMCRSAYPAEKNIGCEVRHEALRKSQLYGPVGLKHPTAHGDHPLRAAIRPLCDRHTRQPHVVGQTAETPLVPEEGDGVPRCRVFFQPAEEYRRELF